MDTVFVKPNNRLLFIAAAAGAEVAVKLHIARGDDLECRDKRGFTPLMIAAMRNQGSVCRLLLQAGVQATTADPSGRNALAIAKAMNCLAAVDAIIESCRQGTSELPTGDIEATLVKDEGSAPMATTGDCSLEVRIPSDNLLSSDHTVSIASVDSVALIQSQADEDRFCVAAAGLASRDYPRRNTVDSTPFDEPSESPETSLGDWEPAPYATPPPDDPTFALADAGRQQRISLHEPVNRYAGWEDFEAELPAFARILPRADDDDFVAALRRVVLLAVREGSVPLISIEDLLSDRGDATSRDYDAEAQLRVVVNDLGAELDERSELPIGRESFKIYVDPEETQDEEHLIDAALDFFKNIRSGHNDPLRIYVRSFSNIALLTSEAEVRLAQAMEGAIERAIDALSCWPAGMKLLLETTNHGRATLATLSKVFAFGRDEEVDDDLTDPLGDNELALEGEWAPDDLTADATVGTAVDVASSFPEMLSLLRGIEEILESSTVCDKKAELVREQLRLLSFRRAFLITFAGCLSVDQSTEATVYRQAISELLIARDEMAKANLRLVYKIARRYFYSGVPIDDLIQEGNIGLLKAVDRFDWRRGFKFSTMATWWIKQTITRSIPDTAFAIRIPVHVYERTSKLRAVVETFERVNGRQPSREERAGMLGVSPEKMDVFLRPASEPITLEDAFASGALETEPIPDPLTTISDREVASLLAEQITALGRKVELIMRLRTGIGVDQPETLEQIGLRLGVTRERIRQIESKAIQQLSTLSSREALASASGRSPPKRALPPPRAKLPEQANEHEIDGRKRRAKKASSGNGALRSPSGPIPGQEREFASSTTIPAPIDLTLGTTLRTDFLTE